MYAEPAAPPDTVPLLVPAAAGMVTEPVAFPDDDVMFILTTVPAGFAAGPIVIYCPVPGLISGTNTPLIVTDAPDTAAPDTEPFVNITIYVAMPEGES